MINLLSPYAYVPVVSAPIISPLLALHARTVSESRPPRPCMLKVLHGIAGNQVFEERLHMTARFLPERLLYLHLAGMNNYFVYTSVTQNDYFILMPYDYFLVAVAVSPK